MRHCIDMSKDRIVTFIRHGKTAGNERHAYIGRTDEPLSGAGRADLLKRKHAGEYPDERNVKRVFISPMIRCRQSAEILFPGAELIEIPEWTEMDFGDFEGKNYIELDGDPAYQSWIDSNGTLPFPNGESRAHFAERVMRGYERMKEFLEKTDEKMSMQNLVEVAVVHGGTVMALFSTLCGGGYYDYQIANGEQRQLREQL